MRGGKRVGAGRKPLLSAMSRIAVGAACEDAYRKLAEAKQRAGIGELFAPSDYREVVATARQILVSRRTAFLRSDMGEGYAFDVEQERHLIAGTDPENGPAPRIFTVPLRRPQGVRPKIIADVARDWSRRVGATISVSTVRACWDEFRALQASLAGDLNRVDGPEGV